MEYIDIIMPVCNCEKYIRHAIKSVKEQTFKNWKLLIINDASNDNTLEIIKDETQEIEGKVLLINLEKNVGVAKARNIGIENSKNRYITFLDSDDLWKKEKLEKQITFMEKNKYAFTYTSYTYLKGNRKKEVRYFPKSLDYKKALGNTFILTSTVMIDTNQIDKKDIKMPQVKSEDTASWWKILKKGNIADGLKDNLTVYRVGINGLSSNKLKGIYKIWNLYRKEEKLTIIKSCQYFIKYAFHAIIKRVI